MGDLYAKVLDVPANERPPNLYELLLLEPFESDYEKIHSHGVKQFGKLRQWQIHSDRDTVEWVLSMMTELSRACTVLGIPDKKRDYDRGLLESSSLDAQQREPPARRKDIPAAAKRKVSLNLEQLEENRKLRADLEARKNERWRSYTTARMERGYNDEKHSLFLKRCPKCDALNSNLSVKCDRCGHSLNTPSQLAAPPLNNIATERVNVTRFLMTSLKNVTNFFAHALDNVYKLMTFLVITLVTFGVIAAGVWFLLSRLPESVNVSRFVEINGHDKATSLRLRKLMILDPSWRKFCEFTKNDSLGTPPYLRLDMKKQSGPEKATRMGHYNTYLVVMTDCRTGTIIFEREQVDYGDRDYTEELVTQAGNEALTWARKRQNAFQKHDSDS